MKFLKGLQLRNIYHTALKGSPQKNRILTILTSCIKNKFVFRNLFQPEVFEDVEGCGIVGFKNYTPPPISNSFGPRALNPFQGQAGPKEHDEATIEDCLWRCEWQPNPYYKQTLFYWTKYLEYLYTADNSFWTLMASPKVRSVQYEII